MSNRSITHCWKKFSWNQPNFQFSDWDGTLDLYKWIRPWTAIISRFSWKNVFDCETGQFDPLGEGGEWDGNQISSGSFSCLARNLINYVIGTQTRCGHSLQTGGNSRSGNNSTVCQCKICSKYNIFHLPIAMLVHLFVLILRMQLTSAKIAPSQIVEITASRNEI